MNGCLHRPDFVATACSGLSITVLPDVPLGITSHVAGDEHAEMMGYFDC
jgi:hypothetical protein